jgi:hypothetical protein
LVLNISDGIVIITEITVTDGSSTVVFSPKNGNYSVAGLTGAILVKAKKGECVTVLNPSGICLYKGVILSNEQQISLNPGLYIVSLGGKAVKVLVK